MAKSYKTCNLIRNLAESQRHHIAGYESNPIEMWKRLEAGNNTKKPGMRFNAYDDLFSIRKLPEESLEALIAQVSQKLRVLKDMHPAGYTIQQLDDELYSYTLVRALPEEYTGFSSSLMLLEDLLPDTINEAFRNEQINRQRQALAHASSLSSLAMATSSFLSHNKPRPKCEFCGIPGHIQANCYKLKSCKQIYEATRKNGSNSSPGSSSIPSHTAVTNHANASIVTSESTNNASLSHSSTPSPSAYTNLWNADTGATSHMTPHHSWIHNYTPMRLPICLADDTVIYSKGVGSVVIVPKIGGRVVRAVELTHAQCVQSESLGMCFLCACAEGQTS